MQEIIDILMRRDSITRNEAQNLIDECIDEIFDCFYTGDYQACEDIVASYLGLEPDYLDILLNEM